MTEELVDRTSIDLDAARAARAEQRRKDGAEDRPHVKFLGNRYDLPLEMPAEAIHALGALIATDLDEIKAGNLDGVLPLMGMLTAGMESLFGPAWVTIHEDATKAGEPLSLPDEIFLLEGALAVYGWDMGEAPASASS